MTAAPLRGNIEGTFAYLTVRDRWPKIMAKIVDHLTRVRESIIERLGEEGKEDVGRVIEHLSEIRYRMMTDKPLTDFEDSLTDVSVWNDCLKKLRDRDGADNVTWFKAEWLFVECYLYRKVAEFFSLTKHLKDYDCFAAQKKDSFVDCLSPIAKIVKYLNDTTGSHDKAEDEEKVRASLHELIEVCLWGNVCDLSLSGGDNHSANESPIELISLVRRKILANDIDKVVEYLVNSRGSGEVHIVVDNASIELVGDLALGDFIRQRNLAKKIVFHGKARPWFVSDATKNDFTWTIDVLVKSEDDELRQLGNRLTNALELKTMEIRFHPFWTYGFPYESMASVSPDLYAELQTSKLTILKGDLNYRKLVGDKDWKYDEPLLKALNGFLPSPLLALRTLKAETVAGLPEDSVKCIEKKYGPSKNWMVTGEYAVAQFVNTR
ncbi:hypothetical protein QR680_013232 [Steinernema hermaphroditum]|uniref:Sugar phosphate phosphatase n=1 Tax=Steinernema hermaphroditum TaxID=289476 RepID=A0AA39M266_9BILA|nr:hypothetical protein QR680_013232 [Steinernema hermaphroditum]